MKKLTLYVSNAVDRQLPEAARCTGRPLSDLVRDAADQYLRKPGSPWRSSINSGLDEALIGHDPKGRPAPEPRLPLFASDDPTLAERVGAHRRRTRS
jgi:hypothetical protein